MGRIVWRRHGGTEQHRLCGVLGLVLDLLDLVYFRTTVGIRGVFCSESLWG